MYLWIWVDWKQGIVKQKNGSHSACGWVKWPHCESCCCINSGLFSPSPIVYLIVFLKIKNSLSEALCCAGCSSLICHPLIPNVSQWHTHIRTHTCTPPLAPILGFLPLCALNNDIYSFMNHTDVAREAAIKFFSNLFHPVKRLLCSQSVQPGQLEKSD